MALYSELRAACKQRGITQDDIAKHLDRSRAYVSLKLSGNGAWDQNDMFGILDMLHEPYRKMHIYFPKGGIYAGPAIDPPPSTEQKMAALLHQLIKEASA